MTFEYGSQVIEVRNPFRLEGLAYALRGLIVVPLGVYLMLGVESHVSAGEPTLGWLWAAGGLVLIGFGLHAFMIAGFKMFRFYVGRGVPANLAAHSESEFSEDAHGEYASSTTIAPGSKGAVLHEGQYLPKQLSEMLLGRKNMTFIEPRGWLARLLSSLIYPMIFLPHPMRGVTLKLFMAAWYTVVLFVLYGLALFSGTTGLTQITNTPVQDYLAVALLISLVLVWLRFRPHRGDLRRPRLHSAMIEGGRQGFWWFTRHALLVLAAVALPWMLLEIHAEEPLAPVAMSPYPWLAMIAVLATVALAYALLMAWRRAPRGVVPTEVSEYREHWQENVHPMDIFRALEMTLANHRYLEIPNRVYRLKRPNLRGQDSQDKGDFTGETLQEIQPEPLADQRRDPLVLPGVVLGQVVLLLAAVWLFRGIAALDAIDAVALAELVTGPILLTIFGAAVATTANIYLGEIRFQSQLLAFQASGTYSESRLATGMSIYDSTRSENRIVRSSITPWLIVSRITSSIIAVSGAMNLQQKRYVLGMERSKALCDELIADMRGYLQERQVMAGVQSGSDLEAASTIHQMNERAREGRVGLASPSDRPQLSEEVIKERQQVLGDDAAQERER